MHLLYFWRSATFHSWLNHIFQDAFNHFLPSISCFLWWKREIILNFVLLFRKKTKEKGDRGRKVRGTKFFSSIFHLKPFQRSHLKIFIKVISIIYFQALTFLMWHLCPLYLSNVMIFSLLEYLTFLFWYSIGAYDNILIIHIFTTGLQLS